MNESKNSKFLALLSTALLAVGLASLPACKSGVDKQTGAAVVPLGASEPSDVKGELPTATVEAAGEAPAKASADTAQKPVAISAFTQGDVAVPVQIGGTNLLLTAAPANEVFYEILRRNAGGTWTWADRAPATVGANGAVRVTVPVGVYVRFTYGDFTTVAPAVSATRLGSGNIEIAVNFDRQSTVAASFFDFLVSLAAQVPEIDAAIQQTLVPLNDAYRLASTHPTAEQMKILKQKYFDGALILIRGMLKQSRELADAADLGGAFDRSDPALFAALAAGTYDSIAFSIDIGYRQQESLAGAGGTVTIRGAFEIVVSAAASDVDLAASLESVLTSAFKLILTGLGVSVDAQATLVDKFTKALGTSAAGGALVSLPPRPVAPAAGEAPTPPLVSIDGQLFNADRAAESTSVTVQASATTAEFDFVGAAAASDPELPLIVFVDAPSGPKSLPEPGEPDPSADAPPPDGELPPADGGGDATAPTLPVAPNLPTATTHTASILTWTWGEAADPESGIAHYEVSLLDAAGNPFVDEFGNLLMDKMQTLYPTPAMAGMPPPPPPSVTFSSLLAATTYKLRVVAFNGAGLSTAYPVASAMTSALGAPRNLSVGAVAQAEGGGFDLTWTAATGADDGTGYRIHWSTVSGEELTSGQFVDVPSASRGTAELPWRMSVFDMDPSATFYFKVTSVHYPSGAVTLPVGSDAATGSGQLLN